MADASWLAVTEPESEVSTLPFASPGQLASSLPTPNRARRRRRESDDLARDDDLDAFTSGRWVDLIDDDGWGEAEPVEPSFSASLSAGDRARRRRRIDRDQPRETAPEFDTILPQPPIQTFASPWTSLLDTDEVFSGLQQQPTAAERTTLMDRLAPRTAAGRSWAQSPPTVTLPSRARAGAEDWGGVLLPRRPVKQPQRMLHLFCATEGCGASRGSRPSSRCRSSTRLLARTVDEDVPRPPAWLPSVGRAAKSARARLHVRLPTERHGRAHRRAGAAGRRCGRGRRPRRLLVRARRHRLSAVVRRLVSAPLTSQRHSHRSFDRHAVLTLPARVLDWTLLHLRP